MRYDTIIFAAAALAAHPASAADNHNNHGHKSPYAGQQTRDIKALSREETGELLRGAGWGFAKAAELNGMPGPTHVLDMAVELGLSPAQTAKVQRVRDAMRTQAAALGERFVAKETELEARFRSGEIGKLELDRRVKEIEMMRAELRIAHLVAHVEVSRILTREQTEQYGKLRGYR